MSIARYKLVGYKPLTVYRKTVGQYVNGRWVEGTESTITIKGNWQPIKGYDKMMLPESFRSKYTIKLSTTFELYSIIEGSAQQEPDEVEIDGFRFEVQEKEHYSMGVVDHFEYTLTKKEISAGAS